MTIPVEKGLCNTVDFENNVPLVYEDMAQEESLDYMKAALVAVNINAYLGIPIVLDNGERFGTLCSAHHQATHFDEESIQMMQRIAKMFSYYLRLEHLAYHDVLTGLYNRQFLYQTFDKAAVAGGSLYLIDLDGFKQVNDRHGHDRGDEVLKELAHKLNTLICNWKDSFIVRMGGDEFLVHLPSVIETEQMKEVATALVTILSHWETPIDGCKVTASCGVVDYRGTSDESLSDLLHRADEALYLAKRNRKNSFVIASH
jgi:diguanylate cyclase (GGDEF)-like protein